MIESHAVRDSATAVVSCHEEPLESELFHDLDLIRGHASLRVRLVCCIGGRLAAIAVAAQIGRYNREGISQKWSDAMPAAMGLRVAMQQQERRALAADN